MNRISQTVPYQFDTCFSPFRADEFEAALASLKRTGFTGVELAIAHPADVDVPKLKAQLETVQLPCTTLSTGQAFGLDGLYLSAPDASVRRAATKLVKAHVDLAEKLDCPVTIGLLRGKLQEDSTPRLLDNFESAMKPCVAYASDHGVILQIEPINRAETVLLNSTDEVLAFIDRLGGANCLGVLFDVYHSSIEDGDVPAAIRRAGRRITNVHLADSTRGLPGSGSIDFAAAFAALKQIGYARAITLETLVLPDAETVKETAYRAVSAYLN